MNALWNKKNLERPANNTWIANRKAIDLEGFVPALETVIKDLESQHILHTEAAIISRLIYRMKSKFRSDKGMKNMEKVNRALLNYLEIQLHKEYQDIRKCVELDGRVVNLPTRQMMEYVLVRTQGFAKLLCRIESVAKCAAEFFKARIALGHAWTVAVIAYAIISRVWYLSRFLLKRCCAWYNNIFEYVVKFRRIGPAWLPGDYKLPENLKTWLDLPWIDQVSDSVPLKDDGKGTIFNLIKAQIDDPCKLTFEIEDIDFAPKPKNELINEAEIDEDVFQDRNQGSHAKPGVSFFTDDIGTSIDRQAFQQQLRTEVPDTQERRIKNGKNLKRKKARNVSGAETIDQNNELDKPEAKKSKVSVAENTPSQSSVKNIQRRLRRVKKKLTVSSELNSKAGKEEIETAVKTVVKKNKLKLPKSKKKSANCTDKKTIDLAPETLRTRGELMAFLGQDSCPGLSRVRWSMLTNWIKQRMKKIEKAQPCDENKLEILLRKVNRKLEKLL